MTLPDFTAVLDSVHRAANPWPRPALTVTIRPRLKSRRYVSAAEHGRRDMAAMRGRWATLGKLKPTAAFEAAKGGTLTPATPPRFFKITGVADSSTLEVTT